MRWRLFLAAAMAVAVLAAASFAQCNRRARGGGGPAMPAMTNTGQFSPSASFGSVGPGFTNTQLAQQYFRQQQLQQMQLMQAVAQRQVLANREPNMVAEKNAAFDERTVASDARRDRLRLKNATKAYGLAQRAESNDSYVAAERHYRRVTRIVGVDHALGQRALPAMESLRNRDSFPSVTPNSSQTRLAAAR